MPPTMGSGSSRVVRVGSSRRPIYRERRLPPCSLRAHSEGMRDAGVGTPAFNREAPLPSPTDHFEDGSVSCVAHRLGCGLHFFNRTARAPRHRRDLRDHDHQRRWCPGRPDSLPVELPEGDRCEHGSLDPDDRGWARHHGANDVAERRRRAVAGHLHGVRRSGHVRETRWCDRLLRADVPVESGPATADPSDRRRRPTGAAHQGDHGHGLRIPSMEESLPTAVARAAMSRRSTIALVALGAAVGLTIGWIDRHHGLVSGFGGRPMILVLRTVGIGWTFMAVGIVAWSIRPRNGMGRLLTAAGFAWFIPGLSNVGIPVLLSVSLWLGFLHYAIEFHLIMALPRVRLGSSLERAVVGAMYVLTVCVRFFIIAGENQRAGCPPCTANGLLPSTTQDLPDSLLALPP